MLAIRFVDAYYMLFSLWGGKTLLNFQIRRPFLAFVRPQAAQRENTILSSSGFFCFHVTSMVAGFTTSHRQIGALNNLIRLYSQKGFCEVLTSSGKLLLC